MPSRGLYAILDLTSLQRRNLDPLESARALLAGGPAVVQLRAKGASARDTLALLRALVPLCRAARVPLFANDRPDLALLAGCDGVHVGQDDLPLAEVKKIAPGLLLGVSTHSEAQVQEALAAGPSYVAVGPVFATSSKENPEPVVGIELVHFAVRRASLPVVAIGGLDMQRASLVAAAGALGAVIGALLPDGQDVAQITDRALALGRTLRGNSP
jgi:thiamine-phosphate pyrophosphorylase